MADVETAGRVELAEHALFDGVDVSCLRSHLSSLRAVRVERGALVSGPQMPNGVVLVLDGMLHAYELTPEGQRLVLEIIVPGEIDGMLLAAGLPAHMSEALTRSTIVRINVALLDAMIEAAPRIATNLYRNALLRLAKREAHMSALAEHSGVRALARQLLAIAQYGSRPHGRIATIRPRPTHQLLADMVGLRRETVTLNLKSLRLMQAVGVTPDHLWIDTGRLSELLEGDGSLHGRLAELPRPA
jgi:CRP-like cAMP-binding protein